MKFYVQRKRKAITERYKQMALALSSDTAQTNGNRIRESFIKECHNLIKNIKEVFPECEATEYADRLFESLVMGDEEAEDIFIRKFHNITKEYTDLIEQKNPEGIFAFADELEVMKTMNIREKWNDPDFTSESKEHLWQFINRLQTFSNFYCCVPKHTMSKIENMAGKLANGMQDSSKIDLSSINVQNFGAEIMESMTQEEMERLGESMGDIYKSVGKIATEMGHGSKSMDLDIAGLMERFIAPQNRGSSDSADITPPDLSSILTSLQGGGIDPSQLTTLTENLKAVQRGDSLESLLTSLKAKSESSTSQKVQPGRKISR